MADGSLARTTRQGGRITLILAFVFPAMIAASSWLTYVAYGGAREYVAISQGTFARNAESQAQDLVEDVDSTLIETVDAFFIEIEARIRTAFEERQEAEAMLLGQLEEPLPPVDPDLWCDLDAPAMVDIFAVDSTAPKQSFECVGPRPPLTTKERKDRWREARIQLKGQESEYSAGLQWVMGKRDALKFVHNPKSGQIYVLKYFAIEQPSEEDEDAEVKQGFFLIARLNAGHIFGHVVVGPLRKLGQTYRTALLDHTGKAIPESVYGGSEPLPNEDFSYHGKFGDHLYAWTLWLAAPDSEAVAQKQESARFAAMVSVGLSAAIMAVGMGIVLLSVVSERRASRLKSDFIANVSHELKTPLSLIRMFGEMVATGKHRGEETAREYGSIITRESERLSHLIDNVLDFARLERGKASYTFGEGDIASVLDRALDVSRYRLEKEKVKLNVDVDPQIPKVRMDENAITLVILNLVDNAIKYAASGGTIDVALDRAPGGVVLSVRDHGPGIPKEEHGRIFDRFYRAQSARDQNVRGSGIGLALVHYIAEAHGGRVTVESPVADGSGDSRGALFRVFLPAHAVEGTESVEPELSGSIIATAGKTTGQTTETAAPGSPPRRTLN